ncbi:MAG: nucleotidyltransferase family protein, partial [Actinomycetota bacterium]|nr:nucleotidyltransferase family protein [Actinomycetota bacterium]
MRAEQRVLCLAARTQLDGEEERRLVELLRSGIEWERLWTEAASHEVLPLVAASLRGSRDGIETPAGWAARAQRPLYATLVRNTALVEDLTAVSSALDAAGVDCLAVKGVVLAETVYGNLALRPAADIDILVHPADLPAARSVLGSLGFHRGAEPLSEEWTHSHHDPRYLRTSARGDVCLELHWALWPSSRFRADAGLWA